MARKRYSDEDALKILREIDVHLHDGLDVVGASLRRRRRCRCSASVISFSKRLFRASAELLIGTIRKSINLACFSSS